MWADLIKGLGWRGFAICEMCLRIELLWEEVICAACFYGVAFKYKYWFTFYWSLYIKRHFIKKGGVNNWIMGCLYRWRTLQAVCVYLQDYKLFKETGMLGPHHTILQIFNTLMHRHFHCLSEIVSETVSYIYRERFCIYLDCLKAELN